MSTRTAIFKEIQDGSYVGIYCHSDGYIEYTGAVLNEYYTNNNHFQELIDNQQPISRLGASTKLVSTKDGIDKYLERTETGAKKYTGRGAEENVKSYFKANSIYEIIHFDYLTYDSEGNIQGYRRGNKFVEYRGSDNNGFIYLQDKNGHWFVSRRKERDMSEFQPLPTVLKQCS